MIQYPHIAPEIFQLGPFTVRWYGLMYLFGFITGWLLGKYRLKSTKLMSPAQFEAVLTYVLFGVILGARLGYILFYDFPAYRAHPLDIFKIWQGGMSFHGGLLGVLVAIFISARRMKISFFALVDFFAPLVPPGLFFGRIGNFINAELWGRATDAPWGMIFPGAGSLPRHPSQLYEAFLEGIVLFCIMWIFSSKPRPRMAVSGVFGVGYGVFRCFVEFFRQPDEHIGYLAGNFLTMGMVLCVPMILIGIILLWAAYKKPTYS